MLPNGTLITLVRNNYFGWQAQYQALYDGKDRIYKVLDTAADDVWHVDNVPKVAYWCAWVDESGKRIGSRTYRLYTDEVELHSQMVMELEDWL